MKYFKYGNTEATIRKEYLELCKTYHPDITKGETEEQMKAINAEYDSLLQSVNGEETKDATGKSHYYRYDSEKEKAIVEMIRKLQNLRMPNTVEIGLIGTWIWVIGDTKPVKDQLKFCGLKYHGEKACWYWHAGHYYRKSAKSGNFAGMAMRYGYQKIANSMKDSGKYIN
jgi:curved DNA-binding protein CbpA